MINNKKTLPALFAVAVLIAGVFAMGTMIENVDAAKPNPKVKPFKCSSSGTFDGIAGTTQGIGNCSHMGKTTSDGTFVPIGVDGICVILESTDVLTAANGDTVNLSITATQCFSDEEGNPVSPVNWCQTGGAHTSVVDGTYDVTGGDGKFTDAQGSGDIHTDANHCDEQPNTDTFESEISGTIKYAASK